MNEVRSLMWSQAKGVIEGTTTLKSAELVNKQLTGMCKAVAIESRAREIEQRLGHKPAEFGSLVAATIEAE